MMRNPLIPDRSNHLPLCGLGFMLTGIQLTHAGAMISYAPEPIGSVVQYDIVKTIYQAIAFAWMWTPNRNEDRNECRRSTGSARITGQESGGCDRDGILLRRRDLHAAPATVRVREGDCGRRHSSRSRAVTGVWMADGGLAYLDAVFDDPACPRISARGTYSEPGGEREARLCSSGSVRIALALHHFVAQHDPNQNYLPARRKGRK